MRWELLQALREKVEQVSQVKTFIWNGVEDAFNRAEEWPAVFVAYEGCVSDRLEEIGAYTARDTFFFGVYVCAVGVEEALAILDRLSDGLPGTVLADWVGVLEVDDEKEQLLAAEADYFLYVQNYRCSSVKTK